MGTDLTELSKEELIRHIHILEYNMGVDEQTIKGQEKTIEEQLERIDQLKKELLQYQDLESALQDYYGITREDIEKTIKEETLIL